MAPGSRDWPPLVTIVSVARYEDALVRTIPARRAALGRFFIK